MSTASARAGAANEDAAAAAPPAVPTARTLVSTSADAPPSADTPQPGPPDSAWAHVRDAKAGGPSRSRLRGASWQRLSRGLYLPADPKRQLAEEARAVATVLPTDSGFGHLTAAALGGWWMPNRLDRPVLLATTTSRVHVQRNGLYVRRSKLARFEYLDEPDEERDSPGIHVTAPADTLLELAGDLCLIDLVPMVDRALAGGADPDEIAQVARRHCRGAGTLRRALALADKRSDSWWESILRLQHVLTGLGPVDCQVELWDHGVKVGALDLHWSAPTATRSVTAASIATASGTSMTCAATKPCSGSTPIAWATRPERSPTNQR